MWQADIPTLRRACKRILTDNPRLVHHVDLVREAYRQVGITPSDDEFKHRVEDLREKVFDVGSDGFAYTGSPHFAVVLQRWFRRDSLFNSDGEPKRLFIKSELAVNASDETGLRFPFILNKQRVSDEQRIHTISKGMLIQTIVCDWFEKTWPSLYLPPKNHRSWKEPCNHDFRLSLFGRFWDVDIAGSRRDGRFGVAAEGKPRADLHIMAELHALCVEVKGYKRGSEFNRIFEGQEAESIERLILMLNCEVNSIDFRQLEHQFKEKGIAA